MKTSDIMVELIDTCGSDLSVVNAARVSFHKASEWEGTKVTVLNTEETFTINQLSAKDVKLINYLAKHKHFSPFNHSFLSFRVKAPVFVARQLVKHKFMPFNEISRRYVTEEPEFYFPEVWRGKPVNAKQGSSGIMADIQPELVISQTAQYAAQLALNAYTDMMAIGVAPEQARMVLPQNTMTEWIWSGTLGAFCDMLRLRLSKDTQEETRRVAQLIAADVSSCFPVSYEALLGE
jgi:thymidylate synthase (FAD)